MIQILRIDKWVLNPNDKVVNSILKAVERNNGECPCSSNTSEDKHCPCSSYRNGKGCCCGLYKYEPFVTTVSYVPSADNIEGD